MTGSKNTKKKTAPKPGASKKGQTPFTTFRASPTVSFYLQELIWRLRYEDYSEVAVLNDRERFVNSASTDPRLREALTKLSNQAFMDMFNKKMRASCRDHDFNFHQTWRAAHPK